jgi:hypothetical protein
MPDPSPSPPATERRLHPRHPFRGGALIRLLPRPSFRGDCLPLWDLSAGGAGVVVFGRPPLPGAVLLLGLAPPWQGVTVARTARVAHVSRLAERAYLAGCQFTAPLSDAEWAAAVALLAPDE